MLIAAGDDTDGAMAIRRRSTIPSSRTALVVLALVGFAGSVALVGAGSVDPQRRGGSSTADTAVTAVAVLVGAAALIFVGFVVRRTRRPPPAGDERDRSTSAVLLQPLLTPLLSTLLLLAAYALVLGPCLSDRSSPGPSGNRRPSPTTTLVSPASPASSGSPGKPDWSVVAGVVLGVSGLALAWISARHRRPGEPERAGLELGDDIAASLTDLDALDEDPDHRRVVIRTYARMERALGRTTVPRQPWETPQEFLGRALTALGAGAIPARRLTDLFEQARFSTHAVDGAMRAEAAAALRTVRDDIARHRTVDSDDAGVSR